VQQKLFAKMGYFVVDYIVGPVLKFGKKERKAKKLKVLWREDT